MATRAENGSTASRETVLIPLDQIAPDPNQVRQGITDENVADLRNSIAKDGVLTAIWVRPNADSAGHIIIAGHRRFHAAQLAGLTDIPAIIHQVDEKGARRLQLIENLQREDLSPLDEAQGYARFMDEYGLNQRQLAEEVGKKESVISETLRFLKLPEEIRNEYAQFPVAKSMLIQIVRRKSKKEQLALWEKIKEGEITTVQEAREFEPETKPKKSGDTERTQYSVVLSSARRMTEIPSQYLQENPRHYRRLIEIAEKLSRRVEELRAEIGEPAPEEKKTQEQQTEPTLPPA